MIRKLFLQASLAIAVLLLLSSCAFAQLSPSDDRGAAAGTSSTLLRSDGIVIVENIDGLRVAQFDPNEVDLLQALALLPRGLYYLVDPRNEGIREEYVVE